MIGLIDELGVGPVDWLGTSMGGLIGVVCNILINDIVLFIPKAALQPYSRLNLLGPSVSNHR